MACLLFRTNERSQAIANQGTAKIDENVFCSRKVLAIVFSFDGLRFCLFSWRYLLPELGGY